MSDPAAQARESVAALRARFESGVTVPLEWRRRQLAALRSALAQHGSDLLSAMGDDLGRPAVEGWISDLALVDGAIKHLATGIGRFSRRRRVRVGLAQVPGRAYVEPEPVGVCLVVAPWNYPVQLLVLPLASALAAGNCVIAKPSELAPATSAALAGILPRYLDATAVTVAEGDAVTTKAVIAAGVDHVFFTGSSSTGRAVMAACAEHLTPVTLELGGKSPAIVARDAPLRLAARKIVFGRFMNAGQSCVAPDYVLVERPVADKLVAELSRAIGEFFGPDPGSSPEYGRIVSDAHYARLARALSGAGGRLAARGTRDAASRYLAPSVVVDPDPGSELMSGEIFGPILPVVPVDDLDDALAQVAARPAPLVVYCFTSSRATSQRLKAGTRSGAFCVNTTMEQLAVPGLPFGGVGESGLGRYHGRAGFDTFSRTRSVLVRPARFDNGLGYPPYPGWKRRLIKVALRTKVPPP